ncbi:hypothetical protein OIE63_17945 [Streptomyces sp. NBC_01795]|uniref:hypothetical protein n=1 Tax=unclassified Streptomyces TaxID=2593676 RepID=UPI002DDB36E3|nr:MULTISPECIES: hypothetical protein [unclassified Streptomyces]WSA93254.1 hypothetical protein OIE63_17945 [Streptomyces sp. NBC_01795]WSB77624.1 hypothetical protein OHB04_18775 [Streptomyces sp. NBC_01775]WSS14106.1 hypothetical protein OG533_21170 [Streptomyces sp. NBC_01186]
MHRFDALPLVALIVATLTAAAFGAYVIRQHPAVAPALTFALAVVATVVTVVALSV